MKNLVFGFIALGCAAPLFAEISVDRVLVRQQWPWSTLVKVDYEVTSDSAAVNLGVKAYVGDEEIDATKLANSISGDLYGVEPGVGSFTIDPAVAIGGDKAQVKNFKVTVSATAASASIHEKIYKIVDLETGAVTDLSRADIMNNPATYGSYETSFSAIGSDYTTSLEDVFIWTGVTNNAAYKDSKLVLRKIDANGKSFMMGQGNSSVAEGAGVSVSFTNDWWMGVFEMTQAQVNRLISDDQAWRRAYYFTDTTYNLRPADKLAYTSSIRGGTNGAQWPSGDYGNVDNEETVINKLNRLTGLVFDLPTEAQWEFSCRAGTTTSSYTGLDTISNSSRHQEIAAFLGANGRWSWSAESDYTQGSMMVGSLRPNAYGLYDMLGNLQEWCLDWYTDAANLTGGVDPRGPEAASDDNNNRVVRGGSYNAGTTDGVLVNHATWSRAGHQHSWQNLDYGMRVSLH